MKPRWFEVGVGLVLASALYVFGRVTMHGHAEPYWVLGLIVILPLLFLLIRSHALVLLAAFIYVGNFKTVAARGITFSDPTMVLLLLTSSAMLLEMLMTFARIRRPSLASRFAGQGMAVLAYVALITVVAASLSYTPAPQYGGMKVARFLAFDSVVFLAPLVLIRTRQHLQKLLVAFVGFSIVLSARVLIDLVHPSEKLLAGDVDVTRIGDGQLIAIAILICLHYPLGRWFGRVPTLACLGFLVAGLMATAARSPVLSLLLVLAASLLILRSWVTALPPRVIIPGILLAMVISAAAVFWMQQLPAARTKMEEKEAELHSAASGSYLGTTGQRVTFYGSALNAFVAKPLLGWGVGGWSVYYYGEDKVGYPHNFVLELAVEQGLLGLAMLTWFVTAAAKAARKIYAAREHEFIFLLPVLAFCCLYNMVTGDLENRVLWFWFGVGFACARLVQERASARREFSGARAPIMPAPYLWPRVPSHEV